MLSQVKLYLKKDYPAYLSERRRLAKAIRQKIEQRGQDFTTRELIESLSLKMAADTIVYGHYWYYANRLLLAFLRDRAITRQKEGKEYRYFT